MNSHPRLPASVLLRLVVFASVVSLVDGHQYFEGIYCGQDNCYECKRFVVVVDF